MSYKLICHVTFVNTECGSFKAAISHLDFVTGNTTEAFQQNWYKKEFLNATKHPSAIDHLGDYSFGRAGTGGSSFCLSCIPCPWQSKFSWQSRQSKHNIPLDASVELRPTGKGSSSYWNRAGDHWHHPNVAWQSDQIILWTLTINQALWAMGVEGWVQQQRLWHKMKHRHHIVTITSVTNKADIKLYCSSLEGFFTHLVFIYIMWKQDCQSTGLLHLLKLN